MRSLVVPVKGWKQMQSVHQVYGLVQITLYYEMADKLSQPCHSASNAYCIRCNGGATWTPLFSPSGPGATMSNVEWHNWKVVQPLFIPSPGGRQWPSAPARRRFGRCRPRFANPIQVITRQPHRDLPVLYCTEMPRSVPLFSSYTCMHACKTFYM